MNIIKYFNRFSNKSKLIYLSVGLLMFFIVGWTIGATRFVLVFLSNYQVTQEYIDEINEIYVNNKLDIYLCVKGNSHNMTDLEFWIEIPSKSFVPALIKEGSYNDSIYNEKNFGISTISQDNIMILDCKTHPVEGLVPFDISYESFIGTGHDETQSLIDGNIANVKENKLILMKYEQTNSSIESKLIYTWFSSQGKKYTIWFWTEKIGQPKLINPLWNLLFIPAIIIDIFLWPIWFIVFISYIGKRPI